MTQITVELPEELARIVRDRVAAGLYADEGEVIRDALRMLEDEEAEFAEALRQLDAGEILDMTIEDIVAEIKAEA